MSILLALALLFTSPQTAYAAVAIATCESGNTVTFGTYEWTARNTQTHDGGAYQFNDATWSWIVGQGQGHTASPLTQTDAFITLYSDGRGIQHWSASQTCWGKWIDSRGYPVSQRHYDAFVVQYTSIQDYLKGVEHCRCIQQSEHNFC